MSYIVTELAEHAGHPTYCQQVGLVRSPGGQSGMQTGQLGRGIVLSHWETRPISQSVTFSWYWANQSLPYPINAKSKFGSQWYICQFSKSLVWLIQVSNSQRSTQGIPSSTDAATLHGETVQSCWLIGEDDTRGLRGAKSSINSLFFFFFWMEFNQVNSSVDFSVLLRWFAQILCG